MAKLLLLTFCVVLAAVVFDSAHALVCPTCTSSGTTCSAYSALITCYKTQTTDAGCTTGEASTASSNRAATEILYKAAGCSGAGTLMTSVGFVLVLTSLAYLFNGKKI